MNPPTDAQMPVLHEKAIARLKNINVQLDALQARIHEVTNAYRHQIDQTAADLGLPVDDIQIEAELVFYLNPTDPRYDPTYEHSDNRAASRTLPCPESPDLLNFCIDEPGSVIGPQGWLFHDLTEHGYGAHQPRLAAAELLRVGEVQVDVVIRHSVKLLCI